MVSFFLLIFAYASSFSFSYLRPCYPPPPPSSSTPSLSPLLSSSHRLPPSSSLSPSSRCASSARFLFATQDLFSLLSALRPRRQGSWGDLVHQFNLGQDLHRQRPAPDAATVASPLTVTLQSRFSNCARFSQVIITQLEQSLLWRSLPSVVSCCLLISQSLRVLRINTNK